MKIKSKTLFKARLLNEYINVLKNQGEILEYHIVGRFALIKNNNGVKLLFEKYKGNKVIIDEIELTTSDVEALWILAMNYLSHNSFEPLQTL